MIGTDVATFGADDPGGHGRFQTERRADGHGPVADLHAIRVTDFGGHQRAVVALELDHGEVGLRVRAYQPGVVLGGISGEFDLDAAGILDHMKIGEDVAVCVNDHAGAGGLAVEKGVRRVAERILAEEAVEEIGAAALALALALALIFVLVVGRGRGASAAVGLLAGLGRIGRGDVDHRRFELFGELRKSRRELDRVGDLK